MEYVQERVTTLHDLSNPTPPAPLDRTAVVVPMTHRDHDGLAAERVFETLSELEPKRVIVPLRATPDQVSAIRDWLTEFDLPLELLWCTGPPVEQLLEKSVPPATGGKGQDVWLGMGVAAELAPFVAVHDVDASDYGHQLLSRLLTPLTADFTFVKGYYARVENDRLYGRLYRLFLAPLLRELCLSQDGPILDYLSAFRYPLAGEFAATRECVRQLSVPCGWGLEVATLIDAFEYAGFDDSVQVDLGRYEHDHRAVSGPGGLAEMSKQVGAALLAGVESHDLTIDYETLPARYEDSARQLIDQYAADARFNDLKFDRKDEVTQVERYRHSIRPPEEYEELPAWVETSLSPTEVRTAAKRGIERAD